MENRPEQTEPAQFDERIAYDVDNYEGLNSMKSTKGLYVHRTKLHRLKDAKKGLESKLAEVNKAIELLEANPHINEIMEAIERAGI